MSEDWAEKIAHQLLSRGLIKTSICLVLGAADTGKTTLTGALANYLARQQPVGIIGADIGQSHIGPPMVMGHDHWRFYRFLGPGVPVEDMKVGATN